jgi:hypothetical protein
MHNIQSTSKSVEVVQPNELNLKEIAVKSFISAAKSVNNTIPGSLRSTGVNAATNEQKMLKVASIGTIGLVFAATGIISGGIVPAAVGMASLGLIAYKAFGHMQNVNSKTQEQPNTLDTGATFAKKFPGTEGISESQMKSIMKADSLLQSIVNDKKGLETINNDINSSLKENLPKRSVFGFNNFISAEILQTVINPEVWHETDDELKRLKDEVKKDPVKSKLPDGKDKDAAAISDAAKVDYSKLHKKEPGIEYRKAIEAVSNLVKGGTLSEQEKTTINQDKNKKAIHEITVSLTAMEATIKNIRRSAQLSGDNKSLDKIDVMYNNVRDMRVELMKEFGVEIQLAEALNKRLL